MARKYFVEDYYTEKIEDFNPALWLQYGEAKAGIEARDVKLVGVRNWDLENKGWQQPKAFSYGKNCKDNTQTGMKNGFVELRFSYLPAHGNYNI